MLPPQWAFGLAECLGDRHWRLDAADRAMVRENLAVALGRPVAELEPIERAVFQQFGRYLVEFLASHRRTSETRIEGREHLDAAAARGRGAVLLSAHFGNWELAGMIIRKLGFPMSAVALPHGSSRIDGLFNHQRARCGIEVISVGAASTAHCLSALRRGHFVGLIGDRRFGSQGVTVSMFGRAVSLPRGPCVLSARAGVPVIPVFLIREGAWKFRLRIEPPLGPLRSPLQEAEARSMMQAYASTLARHIRHAPAQWLFFEPLPLTAGKATMAMVPSREVAASG